MRIALIGLVLLAFSATAAAAQGSCRLAKAAELPVRMEGNQPLVTVEVNGKPVTLLLDSGGFYSALHASVADKLDLRLSALPKGITVTGAGGGADFKRGVARSFKLVGTQFTNVDFLVGGPSFGIADGILGQNILGMMDVEYDLANGVVRLFKPEGCRNANLAYWGAGKAIHVLGLEPSSPADPHHVGVVKINGRNLKAVFDTGASTSILKRSSAVRVGFDPADPRVRSSGISMGVGRRAYETWNAPFERVEIGGELIKNTRLRVGEMSIDEDMLIGADFFLSHRVFVAKSQEKLFFTHNGGPVFELDDNGAQLAENREDLPDAGAYSRRAAASVARLDYARAVADLDKAIDLAPNEAAHYHDRAMARWRGGQTDEALQDFNQALKLAPSRAPSLVARGQFFLARKESARAKADFDQARSLAPEDLDIRLQIAGAYAEAVEFAAAIAEYDAWIAAHPKDPYLSRVLNARCWTRGLWNKELEKALEDCDEAIRLSRNSDVIDSRALIYLRMGDFPRAVREYDASLKLQPKSAWSLYGRGLAKLRLGRESEGQADITAARAVNRELPERAARYGLTP